MREKENIKVFGNRHIISLQELEELKFKVTTENIVNGFIQETIKAIPDSNDISKVKQLKLTIYQNDLGFLEMRAKLHIEEGK